MNIKEIFDSIISALKYASSIRKLNIEQKETRYKEIIFPVYRILEKSACDNFTPLSSSDINSIKHKFYSHKYELSVELLYRCDLLESEEWNKINAQKLTKIISSEYDYLCRELKIPRRSYYYKKERNLLTSYEKTNRIMNNISFWCIFIGLIIILLILVIGLINQIYFQIINIF